MKIKKHYSLEIAESIINILDTIINEEQADLLLIESFSNGREQGLICRSNNKIIAVAQYRTSDAIVIYYGKSINFDITTNLPDDWDCKIFFRYNEQYKAAEFIKEYLINNEENK